MGSSAPLTPACGVGELTLDTSKAQAFPGVVFHWAAFLPFSESQFKFLLSPVEVILP